MSPGPLTWCIRHQRFVLVASASLFVAIAAVSSFTDAGDGVTFLYLFPVSLLAATYGLRGGCVGGAVGIGLFATFSFTDVAAGRLDALSWITRVATISFVGVALGHSTEMFRRQEYLRRHYETDGRAALEIADSLIQGIAAAKWLAESQRHDEMVEVLRSTMIEGEHLTSALLREHARPERTSPQVSSSPPSESQRRD